MKKNTRTDSPSNGWDQANDPGFDSEEAAEQHTPHAPPARTSVQGGE